MLVEFPTAFQIELSYYHEYILVMDFDVSHHMWREAFLIQKNASISIDKSRLMSKHKSTNNRKSVRF